MKVKLAFCMGQIESKIAHNRGISAAHTCTTYYRKCPPGGLKPWFETLPHYLQAKTNEFFRNISVSLFYYIAHHL